MTEPTDATRQPKKTEMIEVRVSHETKRDFLAACKTAGRSASDVIRESMQAFIDRQALQLAEEAAEPGVVPFKERLLKKRYVAVALAATGVAGFAALPSAAAPDLAGMFARLDANGDGVLSVEEFSASRADTQRLDLRRITRDASGPAIASNDTPVIFVLPASADGRTLKDLPDVRFQAVGVGPPASPEEMKQRSFAGFDADGDGRISLKEYQARQVTLLESGFRGLDKDGDGAISAAEYAAIGQPVLLTPAGADPSLGVIGKYGSLATQKTIDANFAKLDANKDGKLSLEEYLPSK